ncbi:MAG: glycosyltransferase family 4 protein [Betaproteobacteria bacterium]
MRLALVRQRYTPYGGAERFIERALEALRGRGIEILIVTRRWSTAVLPHVTPIIIDPPHLGRLWRQASFDRSVCRRLAGEPDLLVQSHERIACCDIYRAGDGVHAVWLEEKTRGRGVAARLATRLDPFHRYVLRAERELFASARLKAVICISRMVQREIAERFGLPEERLPVIYNAIDTEAYHPRLREARAATRTRAAIPDDATVFLLVGSGYARKGVAQAIAALAGLPSSAHLVIVGRDRRERRYRRLAQNLGVASRVTFAGPQDDPRPWYGAADVFLLPTLYDALSNAVLEAMACGLPVITSTHCGAGELVTAHAAGTVCDARDVPAIARAMQRLLDADLRARQGTAARAAVLPLTPEAMATRLVALYEGLLVPAQ